MSNYTVESFTVECSSDGVKLHTRVFKPASAAEGEGEEAKDGNNLGIVLVHPYSVLGGSQGLLKGIASGLALHGYTAVTFDMRGVGRSTGRPSLTGFAEVKDVVAVCNWVSHSLSLPRVLLVGSSAGITTQHNTPLRSVTFVTFSPFLLISFQCIYFEEEILHASEDY